MRKNFPETDLVTDQLTEELKAQTDLAKFLAGSSRCSSASPSRTYLTFSSIVHAF
jgi:hypothetical protein